MPSWDRLGLSSFLVSSGRHTCLFEAGAPRPETPVPADGLPWVSFGSGGGEEAIDVALLARTLHPTLSDHSLSALCVRYGVSCGKRSPERALGALFGALLDEALHLAPELLSLLAQLLPGATADLLERMVPLAGKPPAEANTPRSGTEAAALPETLAEALSPEGVVARGFGAFEERPGQLEMARGVEETVRAGGTLVVEAGPGTGKTFAYLVPILLYLREHPRERFVVSTRTKQLQEQIYEKDLPYLRACLAPGVRANVLKGRTNYLCLRRWEAVVGEVVEGLERDLLPTLAPVARWLFETQTGDIDENTAFLSDPNARLLWPRLRDDPHRCLGAMCPFFDDCFSVGARRRARRADLVIVNHALLLADRQVERGILGEYGGLVVDEAHALDGAARQAFTVSLTPWVIEGFLREIERPSGRRSSGWLSRIGLPRSDPRIAEVREVSGALRSMNTRLFGALHEILPTDAVGRTPGLHAVMPQVEGILNGLAGLERALEAIAEALDDDAASQEADGFAAQASEIARLVATVFSEEAENTVHWHERGGGEIAVHVSPLEIASLLGERLYPNLERVVLTSATLSSGGDFTYLDATLGLSEAPGEAQHLVVDSPFRYEDRMRLYLPEDFPPVTDIASYADRLASCVRETLERTGRKILVLFTSYRLLREVYARLDGDRRILAQGVDGPRGKLTERFRRARRGAALLGTDSFWEGVDLPGRDLEVLIITRLPFPVPTDPVFSALGEYLALRGHDPFLELSVPKAILKLRQGVGRLIRTREDRGAIILTDRRIVTRSYGRRFAASLPVAGTRIPTQEALLADLETWFSKSV